MAKQLLDFKGFKKVSEDQHTATMAHDDGHKIQIVKKALSPDNQKMLAKLPLHQSEPDMPVQDTSPQDEQAPASNILSATSGGTPESPQQDQSPQGPAAGAITGDTEAPASPQDAFQGVPGYQEQAQGIQGTSQALQQQGKTDAALYAANAKAEQDAAKQLQADLGEKMQTINHVTQDIQNGHIDANKYIENMDAGKKITTAIGLFLGGIAAAKTGQPNPALQFLNSQIDRDLNAQKANLENKHNLLGALERQYGNTMVAANMFKAIRANTLADQIGQAAATAQSGLAKAAGQTGVGQLKQQAGQYLRQAQLMQMRQNVQQMGAGPDLDARANQYIQAANVIDPKASEDFQKHYIPSVGVASVPLEPKDRELLQKKTELKGLLDRAATFMQGPSASGVGPILPSSRANAATLQNQINLKMGELSDLTRFTPEENKIYTQAVPDLKGTHFTSRDMTLLKGLQESNNTSLNTLYQQKGIPTTATAKDMVTVISPQGQSGKIPQSQLKAAVAKGYKPVQ